MSIKFLFRAIFEGFAYSLLGPKLRFAQFVATCESRRLSTVEEDTDNLIGQINSPL